MCTHMHIHVSVCIHVHECLHAPAHRFTLCACVHMSHLLHQQTITSLLTHSHSQTHILPLFCRHCPCSGFPPPQTSLPAPASLIHHPHPGLGFHPSKRSVAPPALQSPTGWATSVDTHWHRTPSPAKPVPKFTHSLVTYRTAITHGCSSNRVWNQQLLSLGLCTCWEYSKEGPELRNIPVSVLQALLALKSL